MKHFLRIFIGLSVIMLALLVTALSCNKVAGDKSNSNNNNSGNNSGGSGGNNSGGGGGTPSTPAIAIKILNDTRALHVVEADGSDTILLNAEWYGRSLVTDRAIRETEGLAALANANDAKSLNDLFELTITGGVVGDTPASAGLVLVNTGNLTKIDDFSVPAPGATVTHQSGAYRTVSATAATGLPAYNPAGLRFYGGFAHNQVPPASEDPSTAPFSFTGYTSGFTGYVQLLISCRSVVSTITSTTAGDAGAATPDKLLTGGQTSKCFAGPRSDAAFYESDWLAAYRAATNATPARAFKREFYISVAGIRTDKKKLSEVLSGFPQATPDAKVAEFMNEITPAEMKLIADNNIKAYKKILLKLVSSADFASAKATANTLCGKDPNRCLELSIPTSVQPYVKVVDKTNVIVNAARMANDISPLSDPDDADRSFEKVSPRYLFIARYPGTERSFVFTSHKDVTTNDIAFGAAKADCDNGSESADDTFAKRPQGGHCIRYTAGGKFLTVRSYLGTVFNNTNPTTHARGLVRCASSFYYQDTNAGSNYVVIDDTTVSGESGGQSCQLGVVNNAASSTDALASAEVDDNWVDNAGSTTEVELYAVGFSIEGKTFPQFLPTAANPADNFNLAKFTGGVDNATFKKLLEHNNFRDLMFKVKFVKSANY